MKRLPDFTDKEVQALEALAAAAVRADGLQYVPNAYMVLGKLEQAKEIKKPKPKKPK